MLKSARSRAEEQFAAIQKKDQTVPKDQDKARLERAEHMASLRALRLAKEATEKPVAAKKRTSRAAKYPAAGATPRHPDR